MPPRKRTSQSKGTTPTSPTTSVSHAAVDHHYHLRHTGPTISARPGAGATSSKPPTAPAQPKPSAESLLAQRGTHEKKLLEVPPPGARTSFVKFIYVLLLLMLLFVGWYVSGMVTFLEKLKDEVGWWGIIVGESGGMKRWETLKEWGLGSDRSGGARARKDGDLEDSLNVLADALGISPVQVASALKPLIPPASLASIASKETSGSGAVRILYEDTMRSGQVCKPGSAGVAPEEFGERLGKGSDGEQVVEDDMPVI